MRPLIAVTTTSYSGAEYRTPQVMIGSPYLEAVQRVSASPLLLTPAHGQGSLLELLEISDGLMLTGGEDVDPSRYGQKPHPKLGTVNHARDEMEFRALEKALELGMPIFAICRGFQVVRPEHQPAQSPVSTGSALATPDAALCATCSAVRA